MTVYCLLLAIVLAANGVSGKAFVGPLPFLGAPSFSSGAWLLSNNGSAEPMILLTSAEAGGQFSQRYVPSNESITMVAVKYISYMCLDNNTFLSVTETIPLPTPGSGMRPTPVRSCVMVFINETTRQFTAGNDDGSCPETFSDELQVTETEGVTAGMYSRVDGVLPTPTELICRNGTRSQTNTKPNLGAIIANVLPQQPTPDTLPSSTTNIPTYVSKEGPPMSVGVWAGKGATRVASSSGYVAAFVQADGSIFARVGSFLGYNCTGEDTAVFGVNRTAINVGVAGSASLEEGYGLLGPDGCAYAKRTGDQLLLRLAVEGACPTGEKEQEGSADEVTDNILNLVQALPDAPPPTCTATEGSSSEAAGGGASVNSAAYNSCLSGFGALVIFSTAVAMGLW